MQRSRSPEGGEHKIARIVASLDGNNFEILRHRMIDNVDDSGRSRARIDPKRFGKPGTNSTAAAAA